MWKKGFDHKTSHINRYPFQQIFSIFWANGDRSLFFFFFSSFVFFLSFFSVSSVMRKLFSKPEKKPTRKGKLAKRRRYTIYKQIVILSISFALRYSLIRIFSLWKICFDFKEIFLTQRLQHQIDINAEKIQLKRRCAYSFKLKKNERKKKIQSLLSMILKACARLYVTMSRCTI